jgi:GT2 family glycosyltransferase
LSQTAPSQRLPSVLVVIINWNSHEETIAAIESVLRMDYPNSRIALIDNGSEPQSVDALRRFSSDRVELILSPHNLGYTGGCNLGFRLAQQTDTDYVWLLNNDAAVETTTLSSLVNVAESDPTIGLVSPLVASKGKSDEILAACGLFNPDVPSYWTTKNLQRAREWIALYPNRITLLGTALLVRTDVIRKIGGFDDALFAYWEDTDLAVRSIQAGFRNTTDFQSVIYHTMNYSDGATTGTWPHESKPHFWYYMARNEIYFWKKHASTQKKLKALWWAYKQQLKELRRIPADAAALQRALLAGLWDGWRNRHGEWNSARQMPHPLAWAVSAHSKLETRALKSSS